MRKKLITLLMLCLVSVMLMSTLSCNRCIDVEERVYSISDFSKIQFGMTYEEVVELIGEPTGSIGSGMIWFTYKLCDGSRVCLLFLSIKNHEKPVLVKMAIVDSKQRVLYYLTPQDVYIYKESETQ